MNPFHIWMIPCSEMGYEWINYSWSKFVRGHTKTGISFWKIEPESYPKKGKYFRIDPFECSFINFPFFIIVDSWWFIDIRTEWSLCVSVLWRAHERVHELIKYFPFFCASLMHVYSIHVAKITVKLKEIARPVRLS